MYSFDYKRPRSLEDAGQRLATALEGKLLAGGMTLLPSLKLRLAQPSMLIDLGAIKELAGIRREADALVIGAMTRHADVAASAEVRSALPALATLAGGIGDPQVRNRGTLGGSIANADPAADYPAAVLGLNATVVTDRREIGADESRIEVDNFDGLLVDYARDKEIRVILRGLRAVADFEYELQMANMNRHLNEKVETVFIMANDAYFYVASNLVKYVAALGGDIDKLVPDAVARRLRDKLGR